MKFEADIVMKGLYEAFQPEFDTELPQKRKWRSTWWRMQKETTWQCKDESKGDDANCSVFQQCFTVEQVELQKKAGVMVHA